MDRPNLNYHTQFQVEDEFSDSMLKYINQVLMEEDIESKPCMFQDHLTLQATEESLYKVIRGPMYVDNQNLNSPDGDFSCGNFSDCSASTDESAVSMETSRPHMLRNPNRDNFVLQSNSRSTTSPFPCHGNGIVGNGPYRNEVLDSDVLSKKDLLVMFNLGAEEGSKFLPKGRLICAEGNKANAVPEDRRVEDDVVGSVVDSGRKKNRQREDEDVEDERRSNKQSAVYMDNEEEELLSDVFDKVLLGRPPVSEGGQGYRTEEKHGLKHDEQSVGICNEKARGKNNGNKKEVIDLRALLILCAEAVAVDDRGSAIELLKQIMQHSSPSGDCTQRLAHCFGNALQARLAGTGTQIYTALSLKRISAADMLKFFQSYLAACPLMKMSMIFANDVILKAAEKAETLHLIDFGILYGFQWPALIHGLSRRPGGPPRLRITGVELPLSGFRPEERVQETGHRLARYCKRFNVPFEYYAIAKKWETVQFEDLKVQRNEVLAVNCTCRFKNLLDETVVVNSPRDIVLNLIRKLNPDVFVQTVVNGSYNAPFFVPRFREALNYFSALFDMFDTLPCEDQMRLGFEKVFIGREVLNIIACEGSARIVRPETYKQWQVRNMRAGFKQLPLDQEVLNKIKDKLRTGYHPDFVAYEDGHWLLHEWKGRIIFASTCWTPSRT